MASNRIKGITIEIGGDTTKLDKALKGTDQDLKKIQGNLKDVDRLLKLDPSNVELLDQKQRMLAQATELTADRLGALKRAVDESAASNVKYEQWQETFTSLQGQITKTTNELTSLEQESKKLEGLGFAPDSEPMQDVAAQVEETQRRLEQLRRRVTDTYEELGRPISIEQYDALQREISATASQLSDLEKAADDAGGSMDEVSSPTSSLASGLGGLQGVAAGAAMAIGQKLVEAAIDAAKWIWSLDEATEDYRVAMGKLNTAYDASGLGAEAAKEAYQGFYEILGDTDTATEASQLLAQLANSEEDVSKWTQIAAGVYGTFGDSLPIEGLIEAVNETTKVGQVTGVLADALNWVGMSEDEFNEILSQTSSESERAALIMNNLGLAYDDASKSFYENNKTLIETRDAQAQMDETQAKLGESVAELKNKFFELFGPALIAAMDAVGGLLNGLIAVIDRIGEALDWLGEKVQTVVGFFQDLFGASEQASNLSVGSGGSGTRASGGTRALRTASAETLPYLAQGAVTRPNSPFMAVVGDNPNEPEIVSPLSTIKQAVRDVVGNSGGQITDMRVTVNFTGSLAQMARLMQPQITVETNRLGPQLAK